MSAAPATPPPSLPVPLRHGPGGVTIHARRGGAVTIYRIGTDLALCVTPEVPAVGSVILDPLEAEAIARELRKP